MMNVSSRAVVTVTWLLHNDCSGSQFEAWVTLDIEPCRQNKVKIEELKFFSSRVEGLSWMSPREMLRDL